MRLHLYKKQHAVLQVTRQLSRADNRSPPPPPIMVRYKEATNWAREAGRGRLPAEHAEHRSFPRYSFIPGSLPAGTTRPARPALRVNTQHTCVAFCSFSILICCHAQVLCTQQLNKLGDNEVLLRLKMRPVETAPRTSGTGARGVVDQGKREGR